jgi:hypothetical protein
MHHAERMFGPDDPFTVYSTCSMSDTELVPNPLCNYCNLLSPTPNIGCETDADCGGLPGSCHHVVGRCTLDSAHPNAECEVDSQCADSAHPNGVCWLATCSCTLFDFAAGACAPNGDKIAIPIGDCGTPPYTGCTVTCETPVNPVDEPNVGVECEDDSDCKGGTHCQMSCDLSNLGINAFCFSPNTCQG